MAYQSKDFYAQTDVEGSAGLENLNGNWWIARGSLSTTLRVKNSRVTQSWELVGAQYCVIYLQELDHGPKVNIREKYPQASSSGEGKATILKDTQALCSS